VNHSLAVVLIASGITYGTPLLYAALGELLAERSGVLNLGVEGMMLIGAVMGFWTVQRLHADTGLALAAAVGVAALAGALVASIHAFLVITLRASQIVSGLAVPRDSRRTWATTSTSARTRRGTPSTRSSRRASSAGRSSVRSCSTTTCSCTSRGLSS